MCVNDKKLDICAKNKVFQYSVRKESERIRQKYFYYVTGIKTGCILWPLININVEGIHS
jgi:hypothetical protein